MYQIGRLFLIPRDEFGYPKLPDRNPRPMRPRDAHRYRCFVLGIRDADVIERLWREEQARREGAKRAAKS